MKQTNTYWICDICEKTVKGHNKPNDWYTVEIHNVKAGSVFRIDREFLVCDKCLTLPLYRSTLKQLMGTISGIFKRNK